ncbi:hypothetical protein BC831DRAFT_447125 [Entophlyctis helioformis]|nr:hypothetical protein BC831DRAFT_447125 [Entophlyctis helioformis]
MRGCQLIIASGWPCATGRVPAGRWLPAATNNRSITRASLTCVLPTLLPAASAALALRRHSTTPPQRPPVREYFYVIDVHGQLFLQETEPKNLTSCFKDRRFLDFFFQRLRANVPADPHYARSYEYVSPCGREMNYVQAADAPVRAAGQQHLLVFAGTMTCGFDPSRVHVSRSSGRLYHPLPDGALLPTATLYAAIHPPLGLIKSSLVLSRLADGLDMDSGTLVLDGNTYPLHWIP